MTIHDDLLIALFHTLNYDRSKSLASACLSMRYCNVLECRVC